MVFKILEDNMSSNIRLMKYNTDLDKIDTEKFLLCYPDFKEKYNNNRTEIIEKIKVNFEKFKSEIIFQKDDEDFFLIREIVMFLEDENKIFEFFSDCTYGWNDIIINMENLLKNKQNEHQ